NLDPSGTARNANARPGPYALLEVRDCGVGIAPENQSKIFEPFFTTKSSGHGTGLGLSTTYVIVSQARGWIELESTPGNGAKFSIWLPATAPAAQSAPAPAEVEPLPVDATLLVVEDQANVRRLTVSMLKQQGYRLLEAE